MSRIKELTVNEITAMLKTANPFQRILKKTSKLFNEIVEAYKKEPKTEKIMHFAVLDNTIHHTDGQHTLEAAKEARYKGTFISVFKKVNTEQEIAEQVLLHNKTTHFPSTKKFALDMALKAIGQNLGERLIKTGLFTAISEEKSENAITLLTIGQMFHAFIEQNPTAEKSKMKKTIMEFSTNERKNAFIEHMNQLSILKSRITEAPMQRKLNDICIMIAWASLGDRSNYAKQLDHLQEKFSKYATKMKKAHRDCDKKRDWRLIFVKAGI